MRKLILAAVAVVAFQQVIGSARANVVTGTYDTMSGIGSVTSGTGPWVLTSTNGTFSLLRLYNNESFTFADLTNLSVDFFSPVLNAQTPVAQAANNAGGGGGAPRLGVAIDTDNDNISNGYIQIHMGTSPGFVDTPLTLNTYSNANLLNNDAGRYDLSQLGGSGTTNYATALSSFGSGKVLRLQVFLDSFGGADKTLEVTSINASFSAVPEASSVLFGGIACCLGAVGYGAKRLRGRHS